MCLVLRFTYSLFFFNSQFSNIGGGGGGGAGSSSVYRIFTQETFILTDDTVP